MHVSVTADGASQTLTVPAGTTVQQVLSIARIDLNQADRVSPSLSSILQDGSNIIITRIREEFETQQVIIPFERQELHNESLPAGETRLVQAGQNGLREITLRHVFENEIETANSVVSETILQTPIPEIVMIGIQSPFAPLPIPGRLIYLTGGNAWIMEETTSNRRPLVTSGDLDGRIFSLSPNGNLLLFSRKSSLPADQEINTLWVVNTSSQSPTPLSLGISNVIHFAAWQPGDRYVIAYSTVEPRATAPGWQANNDLHFLTIENGVPGRNPGYPRNQFRGYLRLVGHEFRLVTRWATTCLFPPGWHRPGGNFRNQQPGPQAEHHPAEYTQRLGLDSRAGLGLR